jgi:hypothetical protein
MNIELEDVGEVIQRKVKDGQKGCYITVPKEWSKKQVAVITFDTLEKMEE